MEYHEIKQNLFKNMPPYAQCISANLEMGQGIALEFNERFDMRNRLLSIFPNGWYDDDGKPYVGIIKHLGVYNLVTKNKHNGKPTYKSIRTALEAMRDKMLLDGDKMVSMPKIGCGLDGKDWNKVRQIIFEVFGDTDLRIDICYL